LKRIKKHIAFFLVYGRKLQSKFHCFQPKPSFLFPALFWLSIQTLYSQNFLKIENIVFRGLKKTKSVIAYREVAFSKGQVMALIDSAAMFQKSRNNLLNTRLFHSCRYYTDSLVRMNDETLSCRLVIELHERWYTIPIPVLELADRNFNEWWYDRGRDFRRINAGISVLQKNVRGRNEDLLLGIQTGFTRRLDFEYFIPYLDRKQIFGLKIQGIYSRNKEVAVRSVNNRLDFQKDENSFGRERLQAGIQLTARKSFYDYHRLDFNYHYNRVSAFVLGINPLYFLGPSFQRYAELRYSFTMDHRNYRFYATKGWFAQVKAARFGLLPSDNFSLWFCQLSLSVYKPLGGRFYLASRVDGEIAENKALPYLGSRTLGYENRFVRGYERNVLEGNASFHSRNSLRMKVFSRIWEGPESLAPQFRHFPLDVYLCTFLDAGSLRNPRVFPENRGLVNTMLIGSGFGLHVLTVYDLVFRAEYTFNRQGGRGLYFSILSDI
jgi:outer membrane protein assembly factor BamA